MKQLMKNAIPRNKIEITYPGSPSRYLCSILLALVLCITSACGKDDEKSEEVIEAPVAGEILEETEGGADYETEADVRYDTDERVRHLPRIRAIRIVSLTSDMRDGFKAVVQTDKADTGDIEYIYEWKINGEEIIGAAREAVEWQDGFKKGDSLTVGVIPVSDIGEGVWKAEGTITIPNSPPQITSEPDTLFQDGKFSYTVEAVDPDGDTFDYTLRGAPGGMIIEPAAGLITWQYGSEDAGDYEVVIIVADSEGALSSQTLTFTIHPEDSSHLAEP